MSRCWSQQRSRSAFTLRLPNLFLSSEDSAVTSSADRPHLELPDHPVPTARARPADHGGGNQTSAARARRRRQPAVTAGLTAALMFKTVVFGQSLKPLRMLAARHPAA